MILTNTIYCIKIKSKGMECGISCEFQRINTYKNKEKR